MLEVNLINRLIVLGNAEDIGQARLTYLCFHDLEKSTSKTVRVIQTPGSCAYLSHSADDAPPLNEILQILNSSRYIQENQAEAGFLARHHRQHGFFANCGEDHIAVFTLDIHLL